MSPKADADECRSALTEGSKLCYNSLCRQGSVMPDYRLYLLTAGDRIAQALVMTCDDDAQAVEEMAIKTVSADGAELWQGSRLVLRTPPQAPPNKD